MSKKYLNGRRYFIHVRWGDAMLTATAVYCELDGQFHSSKENGQATYIYDDIIEAVLTTDVFKLQARIDKVLVMITKDLNFWDTNALIIIKAHLRGENANKT